jgi:hypothetical protein
LAKFNRAIMPRHRRSPPHDDWSKCKAAVESWSPTQLIALVKELYRLNDENRRFLDARLARSNADTEESFLTAAKVLRTMLSPDHMYDGQFSPREAKRVVDQFDRAVGDRVATANLLLIDLNASLVTFGKIGDWDRRIVDHAYSVMRRLDKQLRQIEPDQLAPLVERLSEIAQRFSNKFGYGLSDEMDAFADEWRERVKGTGPSI